GAPSRGRSDGGGRQAPRSTAPTMSSLPMRTRTSTSRALEYPEEDRILRDGMPQFCGMLQSGAHLAADPPQASSPVSPGSAASGSSARSPAGSHTRMYASP